MTMKLAAVLNGLGRNRVGPERLLRLVPALTDGLLLSADLGGRSALHCAAAELRIADGDRAANVRDRLAFWFAREGGWVREVDRMPAAEVQRFLEAFGRCDVTLCDVPPAEWSRAVRHLLGVGAGDRVPDPERPMLSLQACGPAWNEFTYDAEAQRLWVPSPLCPPAGDLLDLAVDVAGRRGRALAVATVVSARRAGDASPGASAGFELELGAGSHAVHRLLAAHCRPKGASSCTRAGARYRVMGEVRVAEQSASDEVVVEYRTDEEFRRDYLENLSHGGAFVRTTRPRSIGEQLTLHLRLPGGEDLGVPCTVVHRTDAGIGVQFSNGAPRDGALAAALARLPGRPRRVLVVDDDALTRRMLVDAFEDRGFEATEAASGHAGLSAITDELFSLDAVVTDLHMPGLSGDALVRAVRQAGGETDLALVVISATLEEREITALRDAGADAVIPKELGVEEIVGTTEAAVVRHAPALIAALPGRPTFDPHPSHVAAPDEGSDSVAGTG